MTSFMKVKILRDFIGLDSRKGIVLPPWNEAPSLQYQSISSSQVKKLSSGTEPWALVIRILTIIFLEQHVRSYAGVYGLLPSLCSLEP